MMKRYLVFLLGLLISFAVFAEQGKRISVDDIPPYLKALQIKAETIGPYYMQSSSADDLCCGATLYGATEQESVTDPNTLCFSGGGAKGIAYSGVLKYLVEKDKMKNITRFVGTSAGSITAGLFSLDWKGDYEKLENIISNTNFANFVAKDQMFEDTNISGLLNIMAGGHYTGGIYGWVIMNGYGLVKAEVEDYGVCTGDAVLEWFQTIFEEQGYDKDITFEELHNKTGKHLVLFSSCITFRMPAVFDYKNTPDFPVTLAMRASMAIPLFFAPVHSDYGGVDAYFVDGGVANNYPIWYFDSDSSAKTLGFILSPESAFNSSDYTVYDIKNVMDDIQGTFSIMLNNEATVMLQGNQYRTIFIDPGSVGTLSFTLTDKQKSELINTAYTATKNYFEGGTSSQSKDTASSL